MLATRGAEKGTPGLPPMANAITILVKSWSLHSGVLQMSRSLSVADLRETKDFMPGAEGGQEHSKTESGKWKRVF